MVISMHHSQVEAEGADVIGNITQGQSGGQLFSIEVWDRSMPTNRSLEMNGGPGLESVSFLTEDRLCHEI